MRKNLRQGKKTEGYQSAFERDIATALKESGIAFDYELHSFRWVEKLPNGYCAKCGHTEVVADRTYTPDFWLFDEGGKLACIVEAKGIFTAKDRKIAQAMRETYPGTKFRYLFYRDNKLSRKSKTRYSDWCTRRKLDWALKPKMREVLKAWAK